MKNKKETVIVPMEEKHIPVLAELEKICFSQPWTYEQLYEELDNRTAHFIVAEADSETAGYMGIFVVCESSYVSNIAVFPDYRRQGLGKRLIGEAVRIALENGAQSLSLEVRPSNTPAVKLYSSLGFEEVGLRKNFYRNPTEDGLILTKTLEKAENKE